jgi:hypothetical protein
MPYRHQHLCLMQCREMRRCQEIDLFGEIGGCSFTPDSSSFFLCVADVVYSSLMEFTTSAVKRTSP